MKKILVITLAFLLSTHSAKLLSQNTGPVAPEASSFEPVDASDMVNLVTGDLSYVLPLVNIPSPEGGFSMALSYHAGITVDQEASWVGLGWNITPGAINRGINGFADDWNGEKVYGIVNIDPQVYSRFSRGIYLPLEFFGLPSIGLQYSFGSHRSFGGSVGFAGASLYLDSDGNCSAGFSVGVGGKNSPFSIGGSFGTDGFGLNAGVRAMKGGLIASLSIGLNYDPSSGSFNADADAGVSYSFNGTKTGKIDSNRKDIYNRGNIGIASVGFSLGSGGLSAQYKGVGISSLMFGKPGSGDWCQEVLQNQKVNLVIVNWSNYKVKYWLYNQDIKNVYGTLNIENATHSMDMSNDNSEEHIQNWGSSPQKYAFESDVYSIPVDGENMYLSENYDDAENLIFPAYDNFIVSAQGISGSITPRLLKSGLLIGNGRVLEPGGDTGEQLVYLNSDLWSSGKHELDAFQKKYFYFDNEPVSYFSNDTGRFTSPSILTDPTKPKDASSSINDYAFTGGQLNVTNANGESFYNTTLKRKGTARPVEWFTNNTIKNDGINAKDRGFIESSDITLRGTDYPDDGIGAFTITDVDGKKYYFSLPVYQFEEVTFSYPDPTDLTKFIERRNLGSYAYTWLLTAITGPDFVDMTGDGPSKDDYGYWVKFNYGKWSDGYTWQMPYENTDKSKPYHWGRKQIYYLNSIETRTHLAYFIKSSKDDGLGSRISLPSSGITYSNTNHIEFDRIKGTDSHGNTIEYLKQDAINHGLVTDCYDDKGWGTGCNDGRSALTQTFESQSIYNCYETRHPTLKLDEIVIVKNDGSNLINLATTMESSFFGSIDLNKKINVFYSKWCHCWDAFGDWEHERDDLQNTLYDNHHIDLQGEYWHNVIDMNDVPSGFENKALRVIKFNYDYSLCHGTPNSQASLGGKLTLKSVTVYGKNMTQTTPPYVFNYNIKGNNKFSVDNKDLWGYDKTNPDNWSLSEVINPIGSKFTIKYEPDVYEKEAVYNGIMKDMGPIQNIVLNPDYSRTGQITQEAYDALAIQDVIYTKGNLVYNYSQSTTKDGNNLGAYTYTKNIDGFKKIIITDKLGNRQIKFSLNVPNPTYSVTKDDKYEPTTQSVYDEKTKQYVLVTTWDWHKYEYTTRTSHTFTDGEIITVHAPQPTNGGGLRVSQIIVTNPSTNESQTTQYDYSNGVTTYAPHDFECYVPYQSEIASPSVYYGNVEVKSINATGIQTGKTQFSFETPASCNIDADGKEDYLGSEFVMGTQFMVEKKQLKKDLAIPNSNKLTMRSATITNNTSTIGRMLSMKVYNLAGNLISTTTNNYTPVNQITNGIVQETFLNFKGVIDWRAGYAQNPTTVYMVAASRANYPSVLDNTVTTTINGSGTVKFDKYDFKTGNVLEQTTTSSDGKIYKSVSIPAYQIYENMGPSYDDPTKKNMLAQPAVAYNYVDGNLINASVQTWDNDWKYRVFDVSGYTDPTATDAHMIWRKHKSFVWKGDVNADGTYSDFPSSSEPSSIISNWDALFGAEGTGGWMKTNQITRYDHYSAPLEARDFNGKYAATRMGDHDSKVIVSASNANYNSFAYTGFEYPESQGSLIDYGSEFMGHALTNSLYKSDPAGITAHTGDYYCAVYSQQGPTFEMEVGGANGLLAGRKYRALVWMHKNGSADAVLRMDLKNSSGTIIAGSANSKASSGNKQFGDWILVETTLDVPTTAAGGKLATYVYNNSPSLPVYIDDIRLQPVDASVTAFAYYDDGSVSAILNNDNFAVKYKYDDAGRLIEMYKETPSGFKRVSTNNYKYQRSQYYYNLDGVSRVMEGENATFSVSGNNPAASTYLWGVDGVYDVSATSSSFTTSLERGVHKINVKIADNKGGSEILTHDVNVEYIEITDPHMDDEWYVNTSYEIKWQSSLTGPFKIEVYNNDLNKYYWVFWSTDSSPYTWYIRAEDYPADNYYKVKITDLKTGFVKVSSELFEIRQ